MWTETYSKTYEDLDAKTVWDLWADVNNWPMWHGDLDDCTMEGPFQAGNHFMLKPKGMGAVKITLTDVKEGVYFTDCTHFFGAKMYDTHTIEKAPTRNTKKDTKGETKKNKDGLKLTNTLTVTGPLAWLWIRLVAKNIAASVPSDMESFVALARERYGKNHG